jgi:hypothetical protein
MKELFISVKILGNDFRETLTALQDMGADPDTEENEDEDEAWDELGMPPIKQF